VEHLTGRDRLIVALDLPTVDEALRVVEQLDNVSFFKVGLQVFITGGLPTLLQSLRHKHVFVDLKVPGDIANTIAAVVDFCVSMNVRFLTLSESMPLPAIAAAKAARDAKHSPNPKFLTVPYLSSLDATDLTVEAGAAARDLDAYILTRARKALAAGCDGIIASGQAIRLCRQAFPEPTIIVSPGIRPTGVSTDDHKRSTTPAEAIKLGADYLVVGRPILKHSTPRDEAERIIAEIDGALDQRSTAQAPRAR
jgi:orotidine-5'-phosphate decarboxylase